MIGRRLPTKGDRAAAEAATADDASSTDDTAAQHLTTSKGPQYIPSKAVACMLCADCKQRPLNTSTAKTDRKCAQACKLCPNNVVVGAEKSISIEVDGIIAAQYVRLGGSARAQGRALESGGHGNGVEMIQSATTIFEGTWTCATTWLGSIGLTNALVNQCLPTCPYNRPSRLFGGRNPSRQ